jgi:hypothetical protein
MDVISIPMIVGNVIAFGMIVGGVLLFPTARRLGRYLEVLIEEKRRDIGAAAQVEQLERELKQTQEELTRLAERQSATERLLEKRGESPLLPR